MPFENKELSRAWRIVYIDCIKPKGGWAAMTRFEVTSPDGKTKSIRPIFRMNFVDDYFNIRGDQGDLAMDKDRGRMRIEKEELFKTWGLIRIEECLNKDSLEEEPEITSQDFEWAEKVEKGHLCPSSEQQDENTYLYMSERKIGFR